MALNINDFKVIGNITGHTPKSKKKMINTKKQTSERTVSLVLESIKTLKKATREYFVTYTGLSSSTVDKCLVVLEKDGSIKRERRNGRTKIFFIKQTTS